MIIDYVVHPGDMPPRTVAIHSNATEDHPLHKWVRDEVAKLAIGEEFEVREDPACSMIATTHGTKKTLPLYIDHGPPENRVPVNLCWLDILIIGRKTQLVEVLIEIEESGVGPSEVCGKYLTSALATYYHDGKNSFHVARDALFIQVVKVKSGDGDDPPMKTKWGFIESVLNVERIPSTTRIGEYRLFWKAPGGLRSPGNNDFAAIIEEHLAKSRLSILSAKEY